MEPTRFIPWTDHHASASMLAADPALLFEAIEEQADQAYARASVVNTGRCILPHNEFRRRYIDAVYAQL
jgi:hypothetical protein